MNSFHNLTKNNPIFSINNSKSSIKTFFDNKNKDSLDVDLDYIISKKEKKNGIKEEYDCDAMEEGDSDIEEITPFSLKNGTVI